MSDIQTWHIVCRAFIQEITKDFDTRDDVIHTLLGEIRIAPRSTVPEAIKSCKEQLQWLILRNKMDIGGNLK